MCWKLETHKELCSTQRCHLTPFNHILREFHTFGLELWDCPDVCRCVEVLCPIGNMERASVVSDSHVTIYYLQLRFTHLSYMTLVFDLLDITLSALWNSLHSWVPVCDLCSCIYYCWVSIHCTGFLLLDLRDLLLLGFFFATFNGNLAINQNIQLIQEMMLSLDFFFSFIIFKIFIFIHKDSVKDRNLFSFFKNIVYFQICLIVLKVLISEFGF